MPEKREILLRNGAKFILSRDLNEYQTCPKRFLLSTPEDKNGYFKRIFARK